MTRRFSRASRLLSVVFVLVAGYIGLGTRLALLDAAGQPAANRHRYLSMSKTPQDAEFIPLRVAVVTISDSRTAENDTSGDYLADSLAAAGHHVVHRAIVQDDRYALRAAFSTLIADADVDIILSTGSTGLTGRDIAVEAITPLFDKKIEGFGELALLDDSSRSASVRTVEKSSFCIIYKEDFNRVLDEHPGIGRKLIRNLSQRVRKLTADVKSLALQDVYGRVANVLMDLSEERGDGTLYIPEKLTQQDIADRVGASREMVARILKDLTIGEYIRFEGRHIIINTRLPAKY